MPRAIENAATITKWIDELIRHVEAGNLGHSEQCAELLLEDFEELTELTRDPNKTSGPARMICAAELAGFNLERVRRVAHEIERGRFAVENEQIGSALVSFREARRLWLGV